jgi:dTDP-4-dehydrorhamnose reductase
VTIGATRVYVTGADGIVGTALIDALLAGDATAHWPVCGVSINDFDIADATAVDASIDEFEPDIIVHAAALAVVDECEADPRRALRVNVDGTHNVVAASRRHNSRLVYLSSDYVFDGSGRPGGGYRETDVPNPLSIYGLTKLAGERVAATVSRHLIVRTSWLFGGRDERTDNVLNLVRRILSGQPNELIVDQFSCPTFTTDLAAALVHLLVETPDLTGTVHVANAGSASWHQVGEIVASALAVIGQGVAVPPKLVPIRLADCGFLGERPRDSALNTERLAELGHVMSGWAEAVHRFCVRLVENPDVAGVDNHPARIGSA